MVFYRFFHDLDLFWREPFAQPGIGRQDLAAREMMDGAWTAHAEVVIGRDGVDHVSVGSGLFGKLERVGDDALHMLEAVGRAEGIISGEDLGLDKRHKFKIDLHNISFSYNLKRNALLRGNAL